MLEDKLGIQYRNKKDGNYIMPAGEDCLFPETARWCLGALKNLTRPSKLSELELKYPSNVVVESSSNNDERDQDVSEEELLAGDKGSSAVAAHAILDAGLLPLLLRVLKQADSFEHADGESGSHILYSWQSNSAQDAALYTLLHMSSVPQVRRVLREENGCAEVLASILNYAKGDAICSRLLLASNGKCDEDADSLGQLSLQCVKAVSFLPL